MEEKSQAVLPQANFSAVDESKIEIRKWISVAEGLEN